jgi:hypothetical protein
MSLFATIAKIVQSQTVIGINHAGTTKLDYLLNHRLNRGEVIAGWGEARLIRHLDGRYQLVGGTAEDQAVVREWISLFAHHIVFTSDSPPPKAGTAQ